MKIVAKLSVVSLDWETEELIMGSKDMADNLNQYFISVFKEEGAKDNNWACMK